MDGGGGVKSYSSAQLKTKVRLRNKRGFVVIRWSSIFIIQRVREGGVGVLFSISKFLVNFPFCENTNLRETFKTKNIPQTGKIP